MKLENIIESVNVCEIKGNVDKEIAGIQMDSRLVEAGHLFVAVKGTQTDGHAYIEKAIEKGASAIVCETLPDTLNEHVTYIRVADTEDAVGKLATTLWRSNFQTRSGRSNRNKRKNYNRHLII